jgi:hypothetical protein
LPGNPRASSHFPAVATSLEANEHLGYALGNTVRSDRDRRDRQRRFRFYRGYGRGDDGFDELARGASAVSDCYRPGTPVSGIVGLDPDSNPAARPADGSLQTRTGFFSVTSIGGMPITVSGGTDILEASAALSDGRVLKLNATVLCEPSGP